MSDEEWDKESTSFFDSFSFEGGIEKSVRKRNLERSIGAQESIIKRGELSEVERVINREKTTAAIAANVMKNASKKEILKVAKRLHKSKNELAKYWSPPGPSAAQKTSSERKIVSKKLTPCTVKADRSLGPKKK